MSTLKFAKTHNLVAFLEKPKESNGFEEIINFMNASSVQYALMIKALVDKKKVIITKTSIRSDLKLDDAEGTYCLPTATIFAELERMDTMASAIICLAINQQFNFSKYIFNNMVKNLKGGVKFLMYPRFVQVFLDKKVEGMFRHKGIYVIPSHTKKVFANMKRPGKGFSGKVTPLFETMMVQATEDMGEDSAAPTDSHSTPIHTQPSSSKPKKSQEGNTGRKNALTELMDLCTELQSRVLAQETTKSNQALEIKSLKRRVKSLEKIRKSRTLGFKILRKVGSASRVESSNDVKEQEIKFEKVVEELVFSVATTTKSIPVSAVDPVTTTGEVVTTANVEVTTASAPITTIDELTMAQTLIEIKEAKPKAVTSAVTITTITRPKARGVVVQEPSEFKKTSSPLQASQLLQAKDKGKAKMVEPEKPLKKKDQIAMDEEVARNLEAELQAELEEEERLSRLKEEEANIEMFDKEMKRVNTFVDINTKLVKSSVTRTEGSSKRAGDELESDKSKKQKIDEHVKAEKYDQKEDNDREDLETFWKLVKAKHDNTMPEEDYERVLWGDLKVMFEHDIKSEVWRNLKGYKVTV
ncbi:hypothetical protein Tco_0463209 [Tanacetum coccineum]